MTAKGGSFEKEMALKRGSFRYNFTEKSKQRLLPQSGEYSARSLDGSNDGEHRCSCCNFLENMITKSWRNLRETLVDAWDFGRSDPRKVIFSAKVGLALVIITLMIYLKVPSDIKTYAIWAIFTVILVFEFTIGATFNKGINRGFGTLLAGGLAMSVAELSISCGNLEETVIISSIFIAGFVSTFIKLYPSMKQYEYGFRVFLITYCYILVSQYKVKKYVETAVDRLLLISVGAGVAIAVNIFIYPIWAGEDLHNTVVKNFTIVATSLEESVNEYLQCGDCPLNEGCISFVESTSKEDALEGFAIWEPPHGRYKKFKYPWKNYVKVSGALRHCALMVLALQGCVHSEIQAPPERRHMFGRELQLLSSEGAKILRLLGNKVQKMEKLYPGEDILLEVHEATEKLQKKIDQRSYVLVNAEYWEIGTRPQTVMDINTDRNKLHAYSVSDTSIDFTHALTRNCYDYIPNSESIITRQMSWPAPPTIVSEEPRGEEESKTYESASALSLATFVSLLIEFVARLQNLVILFEELSEKAEFKEPSEEAEVGF